MPRLKSETLREQERPTYDFPTAFTFLLAGIAVGGILALLFSPPGTWFGQETLRQAGSR